ncbi:MAG: ATP--guanido phosphotransferase [Christensenellales bacterium]
MDNMKDVVYSTRIRLARNIKGLPFPHRLSGEEEIYSVLMKGVEQATGKLFKSDFYKMSNLDDLTRQTLVEKHLISPDLTQSQYGAVVISKNEDIAIMINEEDHIREQCIVDGYAPKQAYSTLATVDREISEVLPVAHDEKLGYLNTCPTNLGAGMRASVMLFLPALAMSGAITSIIRAIQDLGFTTRGVYGEGSKAEGFMYQISNQAAIGQSEKQILDRLDGVVMKIVDAERQARSNLAKSQGSKLKDKIMRAYGTLKYAVMMSSEEFMELLALVKLGVCEHYIDADIDKLNSLITVTQPAMLCKLAGKKLGADERDVARAAMVKNLLKDNQ